MSKKAILCVDDEKIILTSLKAQIKKCFGSRYTYEFAESADEALEILQELSLDGVETLLVVSDWLMPGMKGDEFLVQVHQRYPQIKKVMLTGQADQVAVERTRSEAELYHYLHKPWEEQELVETIQAALE